MESMTGFGSNSVAARDFSVCVEARSWNHKALAVSFSLPEPLAGREEEIGAAVRERFLRGSIRVSATVRVDAEASRRVAVDLGAARVYLEAARQLHGEPGLGDGISVGELLALPGVASAGGTPGPDPDALSAAFSECLGTSLDNLRRSRLQEGAALAPVFSDAFAALSALAAPVPGEVGRSVTRRYERLCARVSELLGDATADPGRMYVEMALLADRLDVSEEVHRLLCHVDHAERTIAGDAPDTGRTLGFILQEMQREVNTLGAKSDDPALSEKVVLMKNTLASLKEQAANVQ